MKLTWSAASRSDRDDIFSYIEADSPHAAIAVDDRIAAAVRRLAAFPASGRIGRIAGTRELVVSGTPFIAVYTAGGGQIRILRVLHGAQLWPDDDGTGGHHRSAKP